MALKVVLLSKVLPLLEFSLYGQALLWSFLVSAVGPLGSNIAIQTRAVGYLKQGNVTRLGYLCVQSLCSTIIFSCFLTILIGGSYFLNYLSFDRMISAVLGVFLGLIQTFFLVKTTVIRSSFDFNRYARLCASRGFLIFICYLITLTLDLVGRYAFFILIDIAVTWFLIGSAKLPIQINLSGKILWRFSIIKHLKKSLSLTFFVLSSFVLINFERIFGYFILSETEYVVIVFAGIFFSVSANIQSIANSYIFPMMAMNYIKNGQGALITQGTLYTLASLISLSLIGTLTFIISVDLLIDFFENIPLTRILILFIAILSALRVSDFLSNVFLLLNKERTLIYIRLSACLIGLVYVLFNIGSIDLIFVALVITSIMYILSFVVLMIKLKSN